MEVSPPATTGPVAWRLDKTVNLPLLVTLSACAFSMVTWGNGVTNRVTTLESTQGQQRIEATQVRAELMQQQAQQRIEATAQFNRLESKIESEIRELRNVINRAGVSR